MLRLYGENTSGGTKPNAVNGVRLYSDTPAPAPSVSPTPSATPDPSIIPSPSRPSFFTKIRSTYNSVIDYLTNDRMFEAHQKYIKDQEAMAAENDKLVNEYFSAQPNKFSIKTLPQGDIQTPPVLPRTSETSVPPGAMNLSPVEQLKQTGKGATLTPPMLLDFMARPLVEGGMSLYNLAERPENIPAEGRSFGIKVPLPTYTRGTQGSEYLNNGNLNYRDVQSSYNEAIQSGMPAEEAFYKTGLKLGLDLIPLVTLGLSLAKIGIGKLSPELLLKQISVDQKDIHRFIAHGDPLPEPLQTAFNNLPGPEKLRAIRNLMDTLSIEGTLPQSSTLGRMLGVSPEEAQYLYWQATKDMGAAGAGAGAEAPHQLMAGQIPADDLVVQSTAPTVDTAPLALSEVGPALNNIINKYPGIRAYVEESPDSIVIKNIELPADKESAKTGQQFIQEISNYADTSNKTIEIVQPIAEEGGQQTIVPTEGGNFVSSPESGTLTREPATRITEEAPPAEEKKPEPIPDNLKVLSEEMSRYNTPQQFVNAMIERATSGESINKLTESGFIVQRVPPGKVGKRGGIKIVTDASKPEGEILDRYELTRLYEQFQATKKEGEIVDELLKNISTKNDDWRDSIDELRKIIHKDNPDYVEGKYITKPTPSGYPEPALPPRFKATQRKPAQTSITFNSGINPGVDKFLEEDVVPGLRGAGSGFIQGLKEIVNMLSPKVGVSEKALSTIFKMKGQRDKAEAIMDLITQKIERAFDQMSQVEQVDFIDRVKRGEAQPTPELQAVADFMRDVDNETYSEVLKYKPSATWKENHYRVLWKVVPGSLKEKGIRGIFGGRRPLQGSKGFLKHSTLPDMSEGLAKGGVPYTYNPMTMFKMSYADMMKFITAQKMREVAGENGLRVFVPSGQEAPEGFDRLNDTIAQRYYKYEKTIKEFYDEKLMNDLNKIAADLGIEHTRHLNYSPGLGGNRAGVSFQGQNKVKTRFASPEETLLHEIGHQLDLKYGLKELLTKGNDPEFAEIREELKDLADERIGDKEVSDYYRSYVRKGTEKIAVMFEAYLHAPQTFKFIAPTAYDWFIKFLRRHDELNAISDLMPSLELGMRSDTISGPFVKAGEDFYEEGFARLLNNYLSRDHIRESAIGRGLMSIKNATTAVELGLSPFHAVFETIETASSAMAQGMRELYNIGILQKNPEYIFKGLGHILSSPISPITTAVQGKRFKEAMRDPDAYAKTEEGQKFFKQFPEAKQYIDDFFNGGGQLKMHRDYEISTEKAFMQNLASGNYIGATLRMAPAAMKMMMKPLFEMYIPSLKRGMFIKEYPLRLMEKQADILAGKTTRDAVAREVIDFIDNRLGEMNFDNLFWNRTFKTSLQFLFRSVTWKLGNVKGFGGNYKEFIELRDAMREGRPPRLEPETAWTISLIIVTATMATIIMKTATGEYPKKVKDFIYPVIDKANQIRISLPTYLRDVFSLYNSPSGYVKSSMSGQIGKLLDVWNNKDFYGTELYNEDDPFYTKALAIGAHQVPVPFSISSYFQGSKADNELLKYSGFFGFPKAASYINQTPTQEKIFNLYDRRFGQGSRTKAQAEADKMKSDIHKLYNSGKSDEANVLLKEAVAKGYISEKGVKTFISQADIPSDVRSFDRLPAEDQSRLLSNMDLEDLKRYAWGSNLIVRQHISTLSQEGKLFVEQIKSGEIKKPIWKKGENVNQ